MQTLHTKYKEDFYTSSVSVGEIHLIGFNLPGLDRSELVNLLSNALIFNDDFMIGQHNYLVYKLNTKYGGNLRSLSKEDITDFAVEFLETESEFGGLLAVLEHKGIQPITNDDGAVVGYEGYKGEAKPHLLEDGRYSHTLDTSLLVYSREGLEPILKRALELDQQVKSAVLGENFDA